MVFIVRLFMMSRIIIMVCRIFFVETEIFIYKSFCLVPEFRRCWMFDEGIEFFISMYFFIGDIGLLCCIITPYIFWISHGGNRDSFFWRKISRYGNGSRIMTIGKF